MILFSFKRLAFVTLCLSIFPCLAFAKDNSVKIVYHPVINGIVDTTSSSILEISQNVAKISSIGQNYPGRPDVSTFIVFDDSIVYQTATLNNGDIITSSYKFDFETNWQYCEETAIIANQNCKKAKVIINSNTIELFYSDDFNSFWGTVSPRYGITKGVVLKSCINGSRIIEATDIYFSKEKLNLLPASWGKMISSEEFQQRMNESTTLTVDVFTNQRVCFNPSIISPTSLNNMSSDSVYCFANGTIVLKKVSLPDSAWNYNIFAELSQYSDGDAYDRNGCVFVIPTDKELSYLDGLLKGVEALPSFVGNDSVKQYGKISTDNYTVPVELIRFFTSFGVRKYNHIKYGNYNWYDSVMFKQDVSVYSSLLNKEAWIGVFIGNYDKGGHIVDLKLKYHPYGSGVRNNVLPLFCTLNIMEMAGQGYSDFFDTDTLTVQFETFSSIENAVLNYISTGHGGWGGGDEFNRRPNTISIDDMKVKYTPWRCDCASYREKNPCSGNFSNGLTSSDYSRSGWCPGTITNPVELNFDNLFGNKHVIKVAIPQGPDEGGSVSMWNISGVLVW